MGIGFLSFFRRASPSSATRESEEDGDAAAADSATPSQSPPACGQIAGTKRRTTPPLSGRTAAAVRSRWKQLAKDDAARAATASTARASTATAQGTARRTSYASWLPHFGSLHSIKAEPVEDPPLAALRAGTVGDSEESDDDYDDEAYSDEGSHMAPHNYADHVFPTPQPYKRAGPGPLPSRLGGDSQLLESTEEAYCEEDELDEDEEDEKEDEVADWAALLEAEPATAGADADADVESAWAVDATELKAYESEVTTVEGFRAWTHDERKLHRLMSLRGFYPLMPAVWSRDFLGVPMYPALFAPSEPADQTVPPTLICNKGSQFRATKALRSLFDLQVRVSGLRQAGNTQRIGAIIEKELRRYIAWAAQDAGLDRCAPLAAMPNIAAKRFSKTLGAGQDGRRKRTLARRIQDYFCTWAEMYRVYYASLPPFAETEGSSSGHPIAIKHEDGDGDGDGNGPDGPLRRLRPPRVLYGFVIVQHMVMLLAIDAARPRARPRCFADFNMSLGGHWLDASLSVAIPVHLARAAQLRCARGLALPVRQDTDDDDDV